MVRPRFTRGCIHCVQLFYSDNTTLPWPPLPTTLYGCHLSRTLWPQLFRGEVSFQRYTEKRFFSFTSQPLPFYRSLFVVFTLFLCCFFLFSSLSLFWRFHVYITHTADAFVRTLRGNDVIEVFLRRKRGSFPQSLFFSAFLAPLIFILWGVEAGTSNFYSAERTTDRR